MEGRWQYFWIVRNDELWASFAISETSETPEDHDEIQEMDERRDLTQADLAFDTADDIHNQLLHRIFFWMTEICSGPWGDAGLEDAIYVRRGGGSTISKEEDFSVRVSFDYNIVILIIIRIRIDW